MTKSEVKRLEHLLTKDATGELSDDEKTELEDLEAKAYDE